MLHNWKSSPKIALTTLVGITIIWGWSFLIVQNAIAKMPVMDFLAVRFTVATLFMIVLRPTFFRHLDRRGWLRGIGLGIMLGLGYIFQTYGLLTVSASISGFLTGMAVVLTPLMSLLLLRTKISRSTWLAVGLALCRSGTAGFKWLVYRNRGTVNAGLCFGTSCSHRRPRCLVSPAGNV